jgi:hypothetical protein
MPMTGKVGRQMMIVLLFALALAVRQYPYHVIR